ncbi:probable C-mannosyltransferase DPY19L3 [Myotis myotis]|uniref:probable C-mannosyltransferase DPY19L3 n=1 Tax=Myotis myotis TaxID=51298 RepID=UPI00174E734B|nr:probable C-mannosyltransferase DPY19L3 [Myotis myotis]
MSIGQRKGVRAADPSGDGAAQQDGAPEPKLPSERRTSRRLWKILSFTVGGAVALCAGLLTSVYLATLHENDLWFSNIKADALSTGPLDRELGAVGHE